jgi:hypothetical protein
MSMMLLARIPGAEIAGVISVHRNIGARDDALNALRMP